jgi:ABC-type Fe3+/spermidine/putrescine transport system ATPase subunit
MEDAPTGRHDAVIEFRGVTVAYGRHEVLREATGSVAAGTTLTLLGPSGSGKTTLLNALAGFVGVVEGEVAIDGVVRSSPGRTDPPDSRNVGVAFQQIALWPHMTLLENVAFPLRQAGERRAACEQIARELLDRVGIGDLGDRFPSQVSGGQQQRAGVARAIARRPAVYLLDEPTAHLDAPLRSDIQRALRLEQRERGAAIVMATHDPSDGLAFADTVAVLREGRITRTDTPEAVYDDPGDEWTARMTGTISVLRVADPTDLLLIGGLPGPGSLLVRPEWVDVGEGAAVATVVDSWFRGDHVEAGLDTAWGSLTVRLPRPDRPAPGTNVRWRLRRSVPTGD